MFYISRQVGNNYGVIDTKDGVEDFYTPEQLLKVVQMGFRVWGVTLCRGRSKIEIRCITNDMLPYYSMSVSELVQKLRGYLRRYNIELPYQSEISEKDRVWYVRFLGGMSEWSCDKEEGEDYDLCDASILSRSTLKSIRDCLSSFESQTGIEAVFCMDSEKGWASIEFHRYRGY